MKWIFILLLLSSITVSCKEGPTCAEQYVERINDGEVNAALDYANCLRGEGSEAYADLVEQMHREQSFDLVE